MRAIGKRVLYVNHCLDTRCTGMMTHDRTENDRDVLKVDVLAKVDPTGFDVVAVDEAQFFTDVVDEALRIVDKQDKHLILAGLDGTYDQRAFGTFMQLLPKADRADKLYACCGVCRDGTPAPFTKRIVQGENEIMVGGSEQYLAVCRKHLPPPHIR